MSALGYERAPELRIVWPVEALEAFARESNRQSALVLMVESASDFERRLLANGLAKSLAREGVEVFVLVGKESERAHDALDWILEEVGAEHVITSWHDENDLEDVASFVVACARSGGLTRIIAVVDESTKSGAQLKQSIAGSIGLNADEL